MGFEISDNQVVSVLCIHMSEGRCSSHELKTIGIWEYLFSFKKWIFQMVEIMTVSFLLWAISLYLCATCLKMTDYRWVLHNSSAHASVIAKLQVWKVTILYKYIHLTKICITNFQTIRLQWTILDIVS